MIEITKLKQIRKSLDVTQSQLAKIASVSQSIIAKIESGRLDPSYSKVKQISSAVEILSNKKEAEVKDMMNKNIISCRQNDKIKDVIKIMSKHSISQLPVIENDKVIGLITESDIIKNLSEDNLYVREIMSDAPPIISINTKLSAAKELLKYQPLLLIAEKGAMKGLITKADLIKNLK